MVHLIIEVSEISDDRITCDLYLPMFCGISQTFTGTANRIFNSQASLIYLIHLDAFFSYLCIDFRFEGHWVVFSNSDLTL